MLNRVLPITWYFADAWQFNRGRALLLDRLGHGHFGRVYSAEAVFKGKHGKTRHQVAVKTVMADAPASAVTDLVHEMEIMKRLGQHPHVVQLIGCCTDTSPIFLIMELLKETLHEYLRRVHSLKYYELPADHEQRASSQQLLSYGRQVALGMKYVSGQGIIHRDLACRNVLLSEDGVCKIGDFGLSRDVNKEDIYVRQTNMALPIRWMAPESLTVGETSVKSDVWSFGVLLWELSTLGATPYPGKSVDKARQMISSGQHMERPTSCLPDLYSVMQQCWRLAPEERADFCACAARLDQLLENNTDYLLLEDVPAEYFADLK
ncbi:tyrosine-protein kinase receptor Tie-1-like [Plutella xylostella]|uniref:tyrosine-protein kinase receptor Tie-1-like n=1 Tax=Plutella xylostella TaxID=51655 RepID=UPI0020321DB7|nr:tyrosine-protein kinase receptor Tie-1-like [Plutella xylostella]